uniref:Uncharacterized protein n=1 Tax=Nelumbo nucifera TaxID=4432 RepID=A0A822Y0U0_NELNU|nr:TPA_asm: hypothetical protein HUJ06_027360 [Nelumbo nucifera]
MQPPSLHTTFFSPLKQLNYDQQPNSNNCSSLHDSEPPPEFLSHFLDFPVTHEDPPPPNMEKQDQVIAEAEDNEKREGNYQTYLLFFVTGNG